MFDQIEKEKDKTKFTIKISFIEIYNAAIKDLLDNDFKIKKMLMRDRYKKEN